jgi:hypothetical protein
MPGRTRTAPSVPVEDSSLDGLDEDGQDPAVNPDVFVVTTDLVTLRIGPKQNDTIRLKRNARVEIKKPHKFIDRDRLLRLKAIAPDDGTPKLRTTARMLVAAAGAEDDPVEAPVSPEVRDVTVTPEGDTTVQTG